MARTPREILMFLGLNFLSYRPRSRKELVAYLEEKGKKKKYEPQLPAEVLGRLEEMGYVNDLAFAQAWVEGRRKGKKRGVGALRQELKGKGIDESIIEGILAQFDRESELELARLAVARKAQIWQKYPYLQCKKKAYEHLLRRGFASSVALLLVDEVCQKTYNRDSEI